MDGEAEVPQGSFVPEGPVRAREVCDGLWSGTTVTFEANRRGVPSDARILVNESYFRNIIHHLQSYEPEEVEKNKLCMHEQTGCCLCAFDEMKEALVEELRKKLCVPIPDLPDRRQINANLNAVVYKPSFQQMFQEKITLYKGGAILVPNEAENSNAVYDPELLDNVRHFLQFGEGRATETEDQGAVRQVVATLIEAGDLHQPKQFAGTYAWVGDKAQDFYLALASAHAGGERLSPGQIDPIRQQLFCTKTLGAGLGREVAERREEQLGRKVCADGESGDIFRGLQHIMRGQKYPDPNAFGVYRPVSELVQRSIAAAQASRSSSFAAAPYGAAGYGAPGTRYHKTGSGAKGQGKNGKNHYWSKEGVDGYYHSGKCKKGGGKGKKPWSTVGHRFE
ncbi:unnamed protein product [Amoebophrya sp. A120]|nr:unnamed protein product [Amoebophrya sp. A120]|eukprot:GSA120T00004553001.1